MGSGGRGRVGKCGFIFCLASSYFWFDCDLRRGRATKSDEFSERCQSWGVGYFSIQKFILQISDLYLGLFFGCFAKKNSNKIFRK